MTKWLKMAVGAILLALGLQVAPGYAANEIIIHRDRNFNGPAVVERRADPNLQLPWSIGSVRVMGGSWEFCERPNFRGACTIVNRSVRDMRELDIGRRIGSVRPVAVRPQPPIAPAPSVPAGQTSLRGMAAEFFPAPQERGRRVLSCPNGGSSANCAAETANRFCVRQGWRAARNSAQQSVRGEVYLADVLCVQSH